MAGWKKLCCAVDFSDTSRAAMREAVELARRFGAELELVHVHLSPPIAVPDDVFTPHPGIMEVESAELQGTMAKWQGEAERAVGRAVNGTLLIGAPGDELIRFTREHGHDLLVVGTHGRKGLPRLLLGSVAERAVREAPCSVLVVRGGTAGKGDRRAEAE